MLNNTIARFLCVVGITCFILLPQVGWADFKSFTRKTGLQTNKILGKAIAGGKKTGHQTNKILGKAIAGGKTFISGSLPISYEEEKSIGEAMALQVVSRFGGVYQQPALTRYVNLVGRAVGMTSDRPHIPYHFAILNHASLNAFAAPGGYVFITKGLLKRIRNEAELAAILGHEIAHVSEKHILKIIQRQKQLAGINHLMPDNFKGLVDDAVTKLLDEGLDQRKELAADRLGVTFAARVGYDPGAYAALLKRLRSLKGDNHAVFKTHPNFSTRIRTVEKTVQAMQQPARRVRLTKRYAARVNGRL